jgi:hypothetical protein
MRLAIALALVYAAPVAAQRADTAFTIRIERVPRTPATDTMWLVGRAKLQSPQPRNASVTRIVIRGDTADVTMFTESLEQKLRFVRRSGDWTLLPDRPDSTKRYPISVPRRP